MNKIEMYDVRVKSDFLIGIERRMIHTKVDEKMKAWEINQIVPMLKMKNWK